MRSKRPPPPGASGQLSITVLFGKGTMLNTKSHEYEELTNAVTFCLGKDALSLNSLK